MPTIDEIYRQYSQAQTTQANAPSTSMLEAIPRVGKGLLVDFPLALLKGVGRLGSNVATAVAGSEIGYPTDTPTADPLQRAKNLGDALLFGLPGAAKARYEASLAENPAQYPEDRALAAIGAVGKTAIMDLLGGETIKRLASGDLTPEQVGENIGMLGLQLLPAAKGISKLVSKAPSLLGENVGIATFGLQQKRFMRQARVTEGQLFRAGRAADEALSAVETAETIADFRGTPRQRPPLMDRLIQDSIMSEDEAARYVAEKGQLPHSLLTDLATLANGSRVRNEVFTRLATEGKPVGITEATYEILQAIDTQHQKYLATGDGINPLAISDPLGKLVTRVSKDYGVPVEQVIPQTAEALLRTVSLGAQNLSAMSRISENLFGRLLMESQGTGPAAVDAMKALQDIARMSRNKDLNVWGKGVSWINRDLEGFRRTMLVAQPATTARNILSQGFTTLLQIPETIVSDAARAFVGEAINRTGAPIGSYFGETVAHLESIFGHLILKPLSKLPGAEGVLQSSKNTAYLEQLLNAVPLVKQELLSASTYDIANSVLWDTLRAKKLVGMEKALAKVGPQSVGDYFRVAQDFLLTGNRAQESFFRRLMFQGRLDANIQRLGYADFEGVLTDLRKPGPISEGLQTAIADATEHALKQTYAYTPETGLAANVLKVYKMIPFSTFIGPTPFPRFLMNQWRWQLERSPAGWFNMFEPKFRAQLLKGAENGFATADAYRSLGKAMTGSMLFSAAWAIRNDPDRAGAKYYEIKTPQTGPLAPKDSRDTTIQDLRPLQPFVSYAFLADAVRWIKDDIPMNLTANELNDALTGIRRISEVPMFALPELLRSIDSTDPESWQRAIKTPAGQYLASFFVPMRTLQDLGAGLGVDSLKQQGDVERQELFGPARQNLAPVYALAGSDTGLPARYSPFTGKRMELEFPIYRQLLGVTAREQTPFQQLLESIPGLTPSDLVGDQADPAATALVSRNIGQVLSTELGNGIRAGDLIAQAVGNLPREYQRMAVREIIKPIRDAAADAGLAADPGAFYEKLANQTPPEIRQVVRKILRGVRSNAAKKQSPAR